MQQSLLKYWANRHQRAATSVMRLGRLSVHGWERLAQHQLNGARLLLEGNRRQVHDLARAGGAWEMVFRQSPLAVGIGIQVLEHAVETVEIVIDAREAFRGGSRKKTTPLGWCQALER